MRSRWDDASPQTRTAFKVGFLIAAAYDILLGVGFFFLYPQIFARLGVELPNSSSYVQLTAAYVFVQGVSYWFEARDLTRNTDLVRVGVIYKGIYVALAVYYLVRGDLPDAIFAWFAVFDLAFAGLFAAFLWLARPAPSLAPTGTKAAHQ
jgi:hypothetical protein